MIDKIDMTVRFRCDYCQTCSVVEIPEKEMIFFLSNKMDYLPKGWEIKSKNECWCDDCIANV